MKVNIGSIRELRGSSVRFQGEQAIESLNEVEELGLKLNGPARIEGKVTNTGEGFLVEANLSFTYEANCSRCLEPFQTTQNLQIKEEFVPNYNQVEDDSVFTFQGDIIDLEDCINEQVILALPMKFLCDADCRGICPMCGINLNQRQCECTVQDIDPRLEKLRSLLPTEGGGSNGKPNK
ncbi:MAG TPA: DUF177 domain-containing protein [Bacillota bacterium]|nr:DUF177 domain-containing protein [Bacillota bacterium]HPT88080.1 DUF177 domain-containing protein [Bacillota bacterium]